MSEEMVQLSEPVRPASEARPGGVLQQNRVFLDFFWDLAKPEQEVRLKAMGGLVDYLKTGGKADELEYTFKRLVDGLAHTREAARPGFSLALGQVLSSFGDVSLQSTLNRIKQKHDIQTVKKKLARNAMFGNLFGVLALHQSGRLSKEPQVLLGCVKLLQSLSQHKQHLKDLPSKTMMDILVEVPEEVFEEVLLTALQTDLSAAFSTPEQMQLLLVALQHFPQSLKPKKLKKLLGSSTIINAENVPRLTEVLKMTARSMKKEKILPPVVLDLLKLSLKEDSFQLFWSKAITEGMFKEPSGPTHYLSFRLLGSALPLLSLAQLKDVLSGEVMMHYGEHVVSAQRPDRFKLAPEMDAYVSSFMEGCQDSDRQLAVMVGFSSLTHQGCPVVPPVWRVVQHLQPAALRGYVDWLKSSFLQPQTDRLLDFSSRKQKANPDAGESKENSVVRLRKWIVSRLCSIIDNHQVKKQEDLVMEVARFVFFHAFFSAKKSSPEIAETSDKLAVPLDERTRGVLVSSFFGLLMSMHHLPPADEPAEGAAAAAAGQKRVLGVTADGTMWIYHLVQYAQLLLNQPKLAQPRQPFSPEQKQAWDSMLESVSNLKKKAKKGLTAESGAFQQLFLLLGMHLFKAPDELLDIMKDLQSCVDKAQEKKTKKKKKKQDAEQPDEPEWVEVMVDILLSLLSQQSRHIRQVCKTVFSSVCPHVNAAALAAILDVLDPEKDEEEDGALFVTDDGTQKEMEDDEEEEDEEMEKSQDSSDDESDEEDEEDGDEEEEEEEEEEEGEEGDIDDDEEEEEEENMEVDQSFRLALMKVLHQKNALPDEDEDGDDDEDMDKDMDDDAMMQLDKNLSELFSEQKKKQEAKKDEKTKLQKERTLVREFKIKVLDLVEVFVARQAGSPLVMELVTPLLAIIEKGMSSNSEQQEQDFLRRTADIFRNQLCRSKVYCRTAGDRQGELHDLLDKLMAKTQKLSDSSVSLYYFSACLYVVKVLRGAPPAETKDEPNADNLSFMGNVDVDRVSALFREALTSFMSRRRSPLTTQMFTDLFTRFPVLCVNLLDSAVQHITSGVREHQQGQACVLVLRAMQSREVQRLASGPRWSEFCGKVCEQLEESLKNAGPSESKVAKEKVVKLLELGHFLVRHVRQQKLSVDLEPLQKVLQGLTDTIAFKKTGKLEDTYWAVMKHFGVTKPKVEKTKPEAEAGQEAAPKKKKGFLPESKKRSKRNKAAAAAAAEEPAADGSAPKAQKGQMKKKNDKKNKGKRKADGTAAASAASQPGPAKKSKTQPENKSANKKKKRKGNQKKGGGGGGGGQAAA